MKPQKINNNFSLRLITLMNFITFLIIIFVLSSQDNNIANFVISL